MNCPLSKNFQWDGTSLGTFSDKLIRCKWKVRPFKYMMFDVDHHDGEKVMIVNYVKTRTKANSTLPCIFDELKTVFRMRKRGSHRINFGFGELVIYPISMYKAPIDFTEKIIIPWSTPISDLPEDHPLRKDIHFVHEVRKLMIFKDITHQTLTLRESDICIEKDIYGHFRPFSNNEHILSIEDRMETSYSSFTETVMKNWFDHWRVMPRQLIKTMTSTIIPLRRERGGEGEKDNNDNNDQDEGGEGELPMTEITVNIRQKIDKVIMRIDPKYSWITSHIVEKLMNIMDDMGGNEFNLN